jgi:hypothetical protein
MKERIRINIISNTSVRLFLEWISIDSLIWRRNFKISGSENKTVCWNLSPCI